MGVYDKFKDAVETHFEHACEIHVKSTCVKILHAFELKFAARIMTQ